MRTYNQSMSWASRRRFIYLTGTVIFLMVLFGGPLAIWYFTIPPTCTDGIQNQGETAVDKGGPCPILDERTLQPVAILWARSFSVRDGSYNAIAYIQNPNGGAGVMHAHYRFGLYDENNVLVAERFGDTFIMPGTITPVLEGRIDTGNRVVAHAYFQLTDPSLVWQRLQNPAAQIKVNNVELSDETTEPRLTATVVNNSVVDLTNISFTAVIFDPAGNAFAGSGTILPQLNAGDTAPVVFTWPDPFNIQTGRIDIIPIAAPIPSKPVQQ